MSYLSVFCNESETLLLNAFINHLFSDPGSTLSLKNHFIVLFLKRFLPSIILVGSGFIVDHFGTKSAYQNIILYRTDFPIFPTTTESKTFMMESVLASIEILQPSTNPILIQPFINSASVRNLKTGKRRILANNSLDYMELTLRIKPKTFLFSFQSPVDHQQIIDQYNQAKQETNSFVPDGVCFLGKNSLYAKYDPVSRSTKFYYEGSFTIFFQHLFQIIVGEICSNNMKHQSNAFIVYDLSGYLMSY